MRSSLLVLTIAALASAWSAAAAAEAASVKPAKSVAVYVERAAIVEAVNAETRELKLMDAQGNRFTVEVPAEVENFDQIEPRDRIVAKYLESVAATIVPAGEAEPMDGEADVVETAPEGEKPALGAVGTEVVVGVVQSVNTSDRLLTLETESGNVRTIKVGPDAPLENVTVGDEFRLVVTRAVAVSVVEPDTD